MQNRVSRKAEAGKPEDPWRQGRNRCSWSRWFVEEKEKKQRPRKGSDCGSLGSSLEFEPYL